MSNVKFGPTTFGKITAKIVNKSASGVKKIQTFPTSDNTASDVVCLRKSNPLDNSTVVPTGLLPKLQQYASQGNPPQGPSFSAAAKNALGAFFRPEETESTMCLANAC